MRNTVEFFHFIEKVILRGKRIDKINKLSEEEQKEYKEKRKLTKHGLGQHPSLSKSLLQKCITIVNSFEPSRYKFNKRQRTLINLCQTHAAAKILSGIQARNSSMEIYKTIYDKSKKIDDTEFLFISSRKLFYHTSVFEGKNKLPEGYYQDCILSLNKINSEVKAEWSYVEIRSMIGTKKYIPKSVSVKAREYFYDLQQIDDELKTSRFYMFYYSLAIMFLEPESEFLELESLLNEAISKFDTRYGNQVFQRIYLRIKLVYCLIKLDKLKDAYNYCLEILELSQVSSANWVRSIELQILCLIRMKDLNQAKSKSKELIKSKIFKSLRDENRARVLLLDHYLTFYLVLVGGASQDFKNVKLAKYLNSIPKFNADKKAMNIPIIILQILLYILKKDDEKLEQRFEAVNKYLTRYLKSDTYYRSHCFIKMLLQVHRQNFHPVAIERHTKKYTDKLKLVSLKESKEPLEIEIIKYEDLWEAVLKFCGKKIPNVQSKPM